MRNVWSRQLRLAGLALTALGLMAFGASAAQAAPPEWMVGGVNIATNTAVEIEPTEIEPITLEGVPKRALLMKGKIPINVPIWFSCEEVEVTNATFNASGTGAAVLKFKKCKTFLEEGGVMQLSAPCEPEQPITMSANLAIALHEGVPYVKMTGVGTGGVFGMVRFPVKTGCVEEGLGFSVAGTMWIQDGNGQFENEALTHLVQEGMPPALKLSGLTFAGQAASISGSSVIELRASGLMKDFRGLAP
jgi:hypothetical protein